MFLKLKAQLMDDVTVKRALTRLSYEIIEKSRELGKKLTEDYQEKNPILVGILKGSIPFMAELIKHIDTHIETEFMVVSSYHGGTESSGSVKIIKDIDSDVAGRDILFIEDIIDTGRTLKELRELFAFREHVYNHFIL